MPSTSSSTGVFRIRTFTATPWLLTDTQRVCVYFVASEKQCGCQRDVLVSSPTRGGGGRVPRRQAPRRCRRTARRGRRALLERSPRVRKAQARRRRRRCRRGSRGVRR